MTDTPQPPIGELADNGIGIIRGVVTRLRTVSDTARLDEETATAIRACALALDIAVSGLSTYHPETD